MREGDVVDSDEMSQHSCLRVKKLDRLLVYLSFSFPLRPVTGKGLGVLVGLVDLLVDMMLGLEVVRTNDSVWVLVEDIESI